MTGVSDGHADTTSLGWSATHRDTGVNLSTGTLSRLAAAASAIQLLRRPSQRHTGQMLYALGRPGQPTRGRTPARRVVAATLAAALLSGGALAGCGLVPSNRQTSAPTDPSTSAPAQTADPSASAPSTTGTPPTGTTPTGTNPSAPAGRSVSADNLLTVDDIYPEDPMTFEVVEAKDGAGRPVSQSYICLPENGLSTLGATSMVTRDFTYKVVNGQNDPYPKSPLKNKPTVYTQALQFPDEAAATAARATYAGWIKDCDQTLVERGYGVDAEQSVKLATVPLEGAKAQAGMVAYIEPGVKDTDHLYWESAGVTQVKDRLMITINLTWGEDSPGSFDTSEGDFINPLLVLMEVSVEKLAA